MLAAKSWLRGLQGMISEDRYQLQKKTWSVNHEGPLKSGLDNADTTVTADFFPGYTQGQRLRIAVYTRSSTSSDVSLMFLA